VQRALGRESFARPATVAEPLPGAASAPRRGAVLTPTYWRRVGSWPAVLIGLGALVAGQLAAPLAARAQFADLPCLRAAATFLFRLTYGAAGLLVALALALLVGAVQWARARGRLRAALAAGITALLLGAVYLWGVGHWSLLDTPRRVSCDDVQGTTYHALRCWENQRAFEMTVVPTKTPLAAEDLQALGQDLRRHQRDKYLFEAFVFPKDSAATKRSNAELFVLTRPGLSLFGEVCRAERTAAQLAALRDRLAFYRFSQQQRPPVDAYFVPVAGSFPDHPQFVAFDYTHNLTLDFRRPSDLRPEEQQYVERVATATALLNADLNAEIEAPLMRRAAAVARMRADHESEAAALETGVPQRLRPFAGTRVRRFFDNYELLLLSEEQAVQPRGSASPESRIHASAFEEHRVYFYQEPRVVEPIAFLYLNAYPAVFPDDLLGLVSWAIF
jgi:hypothetical protein